MLREIFLANFNSIKVQLERLKDSMFDLSVKYFNSIKVQLEHSDFVSQIEAHLFQFHKGTIRTAKQGTKTYEYINFNSIKVQLELNISFDFGFTEIFQFHKGTIRT